MWKEYWSKVGNSKLEKIVIGYKIRYGYKKLAALIKGNEGNSLEVGCGRAYISKILSDRGWHTTGLDTIEPDMCGANSFVKGDALALPFPDKSFDLVFSCGLVEHLDYYEQLRHVEEMERVGKRMFCFFPTCDWKWELLWRLRKVPSGEVALSYNKTVSFMGMRYGYICR